MRIRPLVTAIAMLSLSTVASADPAKAPVQKADQPVSQNSVEVASADGASAPVASDQPQPQSDPAKPVRHARVTTCRCGDQANPGSN